MGNKKFAYVLKGRQFHIETDHKALEELTRKPEFTNNKLNRWIEEIQEENFTISYIKGCNMEFADQLSRIHKTKKMNGFMMTM